MSSTGTEHDSPHIQIAADERAHGNNRLLVVLIVIFSTCFFLSAAFLVIGPLTIERPHIPSSGLIEDSIIAEFLFGHLLSYTMAGFVALISAFLTLRSISKLTNLQHEIVRRADRRLLEPLIESANSDAIDQYIRLSALSGFSGTFVKLGFSGLPLATATLTVGFVLLSVIVTEQSGQILELGKLTLGAFIGSFVQRNIEQTKQATATGGKTPPEAFFS